MNQEWIQNQKGMSKKLKTPIYIVSKGRSQYMISSKALTLMGVDHFVVVEPKEVKLYKDSVNKMNLRASILELDLKFKEKYELLDEAGQTKSTGPGPARNFAWDHSERNGAAWHWVMDDNIRSFRRLNNNEKVKVSSGVMFEAMEDFCKRYKNVGMAGPNYLMFAPARTKIPPFIINTRIYSCNLIKNCTPFKWRGRYNEDTILSLDILKSGLCTVQFNAFLQEKMNTQSIGGGNTEDFYSKEGKKFKDCKYTDKGTLEKSKMLARVYPEIARVVFRFKRWHHLVNYSGFKQKLIRRDNFDLISVNKVDNYGMNIVKIK